MGRLGAREFADREQARRQLLEMGMREPDRILAILPEQDPNLDIRRICGELRTTLSWEARRQKAAARAAGHPALLAALQALYEDPRDLLATGDPDPGTGGKDRAGNKLEKAARAGKGHPATASILAEFLDHEEMHVRWCVLRLLRETGGADAARGIARLIDDPDDRIRRDAIHALGTLGERSAAGRIRGILSDDNPEVRGAAATALGRLGNRSDLPKLAALLEDPWEYVQGTAAIGMVHLIDPAGGEAFALDRARKWWNKHKGDPEFNKTGDRSQKSGDKNE